MELVKLLPEFSARPWGRTDLSLFYRRPAQQDSVIGEAWLSSLECRVLDSRSEELGRLGELWARMSPAERGPAWAGVERFPLLAKFIFTTEKLSIQVHPDDGYARIHEGEPWGKSEMWYVVDAAPGAWVGVGLNREIGLGEFEALLGKAEIEAVLQRIPVKPGDVVYVPAGTLHTIGPGLVLCEIQQYSDVTYRIYDYDRIGPDGCQRALHLGKALATANLTGRGAGRVNPVPLKGSEGWSFTSSPYFVVEKRELKATVELPKEHSHLDLVVILSGEGLLKGERTGIEYRQGDAFLISANASFLGVEPGGRTEWLRAFPTEPSRWMTA